MTIALIMFKIDNNISSRISNSIDLITMLATCTSVYLLYKTLKEQQKQIKQNTKDVELNRAIEFINNQLNRTEEHYKTNLGNRTDELKKLLNLIYSNDYRTFNSLIKNDDYFKNIVGFLFKLNLYGFEIKNAFRLYYQIIFKDIFDEKEIIMLLALINQSFFGVNFRKHVNFSMRLLASLEGYEQHLGESLKLSKTPRLFLEDANELSKVLSMLMLDVELNSSYRIKEITKYFENESKPKHDFLFRK